MSEHLVDPEAQTEERPVDAARVIRHMAETLARLAPLEEFKFLRGEIEKKRERMSRGLAQRLMGGEEMVQLQRQVDFDRGFLTGMSYPFECVQGAVNTLREMDASSGTSEPEEETVDMWREPQ